jgi:superfamily I DNA/RNA helicase
LIIVAGPGTGKTRTLTTRIAYLIQAKGAPAEAVLAITFTNKAAAEMAERLEGMLAADVVGRVTIKTFHAFGAMLLREYAERLGLSPDTDSALSCFAIYTDEDRGVLLRQACPELRQGEIEGYLAQISAAKNQLHGPADDDEIYRRYEAALRASQALDFDDLIFQTVRLLESYPDVLAAVRARYRWISVDEYQDINLAQYRLLRLLTSPLPCQGRACPEPVEGGVGVVRSNLCVIGDPDQAIYGFRGADRRYFLQFEQDYPGARLLHLSQNYRSTQFILDAATQVIAKSRDDASRSPAEALRIFSGFVDQVKLDVYTAPTDKAEAEYVVHQIEQMVGGTSYFSLDSGRATGDTQAVARSFADFAVLYRVAAQSHLLAEAFDRSGIPYQTAGQTPLYAHPAVREVLAYLWLLHSPGSRLHLTTILAAGKPTFSPQAVGQFSKLSYNSLADMFQLAAKTGDFTTAQRQHLATLAAFWRELEQDAENAAVGRLIEKVQQFITAQRGEPPAADAERVRRLTLRAASYGDRLADFLESTALQSETDLYDPRADRVALLTLHAAKGLEFPVVFIVGCEEGLLPYMRPARPGQSEREGAATDIEEERRLFYVGLTRARHKLILTHARDRFLFGQHRQNPPSRFVGDIEAVLKEVQAMKYRRPEKKREDVQLSLF